MSASTRDSTLSSLHASEETAIKLPMELWMVIADLDDIELYKVVICLSQWHYKYINNEWMKRIKGDFTEAPQFEPHESCRSYYYRMKKELSGRTQMLYSGAGQQSEFERAAELGLEKRVASLLKNTPASGISQYSLFRISKCINYANPKLTLLLLDYAKALPAAEQSQIIYSACHALIERVNMDTDSSESLAILWQRLSTEQRNDFFNASGNTKLSTLEKIKHELSELLYSIDESVQLQTNIINFYAEWKITRLSLTSTNLEAVLAHFPIEQRDDLIESAIYFQLICGEKLLHPHSVNKVFFPETAISKVDKPGRNPTFYERCCNVLINHLSLARKQQLSTNIQLFLKRLYDADLKTVIDADLLPAFFKAKLEVQSQIDQNVDPVTRTNFSADEWDLYLYSMSPRPHMRTLYDRPIPVTKQKTQVIADALYISSLMDPYTLIDGGALFSRLSYEADHAIFSHLLRIYACGNADPVLLQIVINQFPKEQVIEEIGTLLLLYPLSYRQLKDLFDLCETQSILTQVLQNLVAGHYKLSESHCQRIQQYFPNFPWQKLTDDLFFGSHQNKIKEMLQVGERGLFKHSFLGAYLDAIGSPLRIKERDVYLNQAIISYLVSKPNPEVASQLARAVRSSYLGKFFVPSVTTYIRVSLLFDRKEALDLLLETLDEEKQSRMLVDLASYDADNKTSLANKLLASYRIQPSVFMRGLSNFFLSKFLFKKDMYHALTCLMSPLAIKVVLSKLLKEKFSDLTDSIHLINRSYQHGHYSLVREYMSFTHGYDKNSAKDDLITHLSSCMSQEEASILLLSALNEKSPELLPDIQTYINFSRNHGIYQNFKNLFYAVTLYALVQYTLRGNKGSQEAVALFKKEKGNIDPIAVSQVAMRFAIHHRDDRVLRGIARSLASWRAKLQIDVDLRAQMTRFSNELTDSERLILKEMTATYLITAPPHRLQLLAAPGSVAREAEPSRVEGRASPLLPY